MIRNNFRDNRFNRSKFHRQGRPVKTWQTGRDYSRYINQEVLEHTQNDITIEHAFDDFPVDITIKRNIKNHGYNIPTPIQDRCIIPIAEGRDVIGMANTGTGKTAAFLIPLINKIIHNRREKVLIVIPTRELAVQIDTELKIIANNLSIFSLLCIGGASINNQIQGLQKKNNSVIIGTPGRLRDLIQRKALDLTGFRSVVLDEVDRMVDIGFIKDIKYIISLLPRERQSLFFSATVSSETENIIGDFVRNPVKVSVKQQEIAAQIHQDIIRVKDKNEKIEKLKLLLKQSEFKKVLIFGRTKWGVMRLSRKLQQTGFNADSIHGNKTLNQRLKVLELFRRNQLHVLVATDVVARGIDIADVSHVINYDEPASYTDYIHRVGRTGRAYKYGKALTFVG